MTHAHIYTFRLYEQQKFDMSKNDKLHSSIVSSSVRRLVKIIRIKRGFNESRCLGRSIFSEMKLNLNIFGTQLVVLSLFTFM